MNERNRELFALIPASLLVTAGFTAVFIQREDLLSDLSLTYGLIFLGLCLAAHIVLRMTLPHADPYLFPLVAVLACFGLVMLYRLDEDLAREQAQWFVVGLIFFTATIVALRKDHRVLERYRYSIALAGIVLLLLPRLGNPVNGAYLSFDMGPIAFQPAELAKIAIVIFLASYLRDTRQVLVVGARRFAGITFPPLKHLGPLLAVWGTAMLLLFVIQDLGSSVMFFGAFLALVYVATNRISFVVIGLGLFAIGARVLYALRPTIEGRVDAWLHPFDPDLYDAEGRRQLSDRPVGLLAGRRRPAGPGLRPGVRPAAPASCRRTRTSSTPSSRTSSGCSVPPPSCSSTCSWSSAASRRRCSRQTRSPSCSRPA